MTVVGDETIGEKDPLLARLLAAATAGAPPAGPAQKRAPVRITLDPDDRPVAKGKLCGQHAGFNLHGATRVAYVSWSDLLRKTFAIDTICPRCKSPLRLIALIETEDTITKILSAMGLPTEAPKPWPARPPPSQSGGEGGDWLN